MLPIVQLTLRLHVSRPVRLLRLHLRQVQPRNLPRQVGFPLTAIHRILVTSLLTLSLTPAIPSLSPRLLTLPIRGLLPSFTRFALPRVLSLTLRLRGAGSSLGLASQSLPPPCGASVCTLVLRRCRKRLPLGRRLSLAVQDPCRARFYALADEPLFAASQPVNSAFAQLVGQRSFAGKRWGAITFSEMERLERVFQVQLEVTSSTLWLMSGILATLKTDGFQPSDPALFNSALSSVSAALSRAARTASAGSIFLRAKRRESMLAHTTLPVPDSQKRDLTVTPGSSTGLFNSSLLAEVISQVQSSSQVSSNLALSRAFRRGRSTPSSSSPLTGPRLPSFARGRQSTKRSSSSSRSGGRKRFRGGKGGAPSSGPSGFRK